MIPEALRGPGAWSRLFLSFLLLHVSAGAASAQTTKASSWEFDVGGGVNGSQGGTLTTTQPVLVTDGSSFATPGSFATLDRSISSWFISEGGTFLMPNIPSLMQTVQTVGASGRTRGVVGGHATYWLTDKVGIEMAASFSFGAPTEIDAATLSTIDQSRAAFANAFTSLFAAAPGVYVLPHADAALETATASGGQLLVTGALVLSPLSGRTQPYVLAGGGERSVVGADETASLRGSYNFTTSSGVPIAQSDTVTLTYSGGHGLVALFGGGLRQYLTARSGLRVDVRAILGHKTDEVTLSVTPSSQTGMPSGFLVQNPPLSNGTIVFSNTPSQQSTLSGPTVSNLETAEGTGWRWTWETTVGWFWRF